MHTNNFSICDVAKQFFIDIKFNFAFNKKYYAKDMKKVWLMKKDKCFII